jgi:hypothetical protein
MATTPLSEEIKMKTGTVNGVQAVRYPNGMVFILVGSRWFRPIGQENNFIAD